jgi:hypothetical protein
MLLASSPSRAAETITHPFQGVTLIHRTETVPRKLDIHVAIIDTLAPGIRFQVSPESPHANDTTIASTTRNFMTSIGAELAINGDFYSSAGPIAGVEHKNPSGFAASLGNAYSTFDSSRPAFHVGKNNVSHIVTGSGYTPSGGVPVWNAVGGSDHLIQNGVLPTYWNDSSHGRYAFANELHPRTAIGMNSDRTKVAFFVVDGRRAGFSEGMNFPEIADMLLNDYGMHWAINLDGGGSTTMAINDGTPRVLNRPSDNSERAVANSLALFARPTPPPVPASARLNAYQEQPSNYSHTGAQISSEIATTNRGSSTSIRVGYDTTDQKSRGVLSFDLSGIPSNATIHSVSLTLDAFSVSGTSTNRYVDLEVYKLTDPIVENDVTWNRAGVGNNWSTSGGDFAGQPLSSLVAQKTTGLKTFVSTVDFVVAAQQALVSGDPLSLLVTALDSETWGAANGFSLNMRFRSDDAILGQRPMLNIYYTPMSGDFNADGLIDAADYVSWRKGMGTPPSETWYQVWRSKFGVGSAGGTSSAVPEPAGWWLMMLCLLFGRCRTRQR